MGSFVISTVFRISIGVCFAETIVDAKIKAICATSLIRARLRSAGEYRGFIASLVRISSLSCHSYRSHGSHKFQSEGFEQL